MCLQAIYGDIQKFVHSNTHVSKETETKGAFVDTEENFPLDKLNKLFESSFLAYLQYRQSSMDHTPYAIIVDKKMQRVIITIRGTD